MINRQAVFCASLCLSVFAIRQSAGGAEAKVAPTAAGPVKMDSQNPGAIVIKSLPAGTPVKNCTEWATLIPPIVPAGTHCKRLGGNQKICDYRFPPQDYGVYQVGADSLVGQVGTALPVNFQLSHFGSGDAYIYLFGQINWGDDTATPALPFNQTITLTHRYAAAGTYTISAYFGAQYKYNNSGWTGSYEGCVDSNAIAVTIR